MDADRQRYERDNADEVAALRRLGLVTASMEKLVLEYLRENFEDFQYANVTDRVDCAREVITIS